MNSLYIYLLLGSHENKNHKLFTSTLLISAVKNTCCLDPITGLTISWLQLYLVSLITVCCGQVAFKKQGTYLDIAKLRLSSVIVQQFIFHLNYIYSFLFNSRKTKHLKLRSLQVTCDD